MPHHASNPASGPTHTGPTHTGDAPPLGVDLTGDLPCIGCGYNLRGLSIRSVCSECGTPVRATILARVDPMAEQLRPLTRPGLTAHGLLAWAWGATLAAVLVWIARLLEVSNELIGLPTAARGLLRAASGFWKIELVCLSVSMLGAVVLIRPFRRLAPWEIFKASAAVLAYLPLLYIHYQLQSDAGVPSSTPFVGASLTAGDELLNAGRSMLRLAEGGLIIAIILGLRANAVSLAERSLVIRTGRVDTQPIMSLVWAMAVVMGGDLLAIGFARTDGLLDWIVEVSALLMIVVGSFLFTLGLVGVVIDTHRLRPVLLEPAPGLSDIFRDRDAKDADGGRS